MPDAATEMSTLTCNASLATEVPDEPDAETHGLLHTPLIAAEGQAAGQAALDLGAMSSWPHAYSDTHLLWLATSRPQAVRSSSTLATALLAVAFFIPVLSLATPESLQPVQALADAISALVDVFNGSIAIRT